MDVLDLLLLILAAICFVAYAFGMRHKAVDILALGLFFWVMVPLINVLQGFS